MKNNTIIKRKLSLIVITLMIMNIILPSVSAIEFNPGGNKDDEEYKEYNAYLEQIQISTVMGLNMGYDEFGEQVDNTENDSLIVEGTVRINKKLENEEVELLNDIPCIDLIDGDNNLISSAEVVCESEYTSNPSDLYYITFYDLSIESDKVYKLKTTFKDNNENEITKLITYSGKLVLSEGKNVNLKYMSNNNILNIVFNIKVDKENENQNSIDVIAKTNVAQNCIDGFQSTYNSGYKQIDFNKAINDLGNKFKIHFNNYMSNIEDGKMYVYAVKYNSYNDVDIVIKYLLDAESGVTFELATKKISIKYTNDNYTISSSIKNKIDNIVSNIPTNTILEFELDSNYNNKIDSYDYKTNILKLTDSSIFVEETPNTGSLGIINKMEFVSIAIGTEDYIYNEGATVFYQVRPIISIPKKYSSDYQRLDYAKKIIEEYLKEYINNGMVVESITLNQDNKNIVNVKTVEKTAFGTSTITDEIILKTIDYIKGDLDKNGVVNSNDAALALDLYNNNSVTDEHLIIGDMDGDGVINSNDAAAILDVYNSGV